MTDIQVYIYIFCNLFEFLTWLGFILAVLVIGMRLERIKI